MKKNPEISILMPLYNASLYLEECINSVLAQSFPNFEFIIVDDGSTDNSIKILESYNDERIRLIKNSHNFIKSLNIGMTVAQGKYIARMDADDIMLKDRLKIQFDYLEDNPNIDICGAWYETFGKTNYSVKHVLSHNEIIMDAMWHCPIGHPTVTMRSSIKHLFPMKDGICQIYSNNNLYAEDYRLWIELIQKGCRFSNIPQILLKHRMSNTQITSVKKKEMLKATFEIQSEYIERVVENIVYIDKTYHDIIDYGIELYNNDKISLSSLINIIKNIASNITSQLFMNKAIIKHGPLVSIVMPIYNATLFLKDAIDSILSQTYQNFEFIIINDGSTDAPGDIIKRYTDNRIIYINHKNNSGNYKRRNEGCRLAKGKYICVMDGDDIAMPHRLARQVKLMENNYDILALGSYYENNNRTIIKKNKEYDLLKIKLLINNMFLHPSLIIRKEVLQHIGYYNEKYFYSADYDLVCKIALLGKIINIDEPLMKYRTHQNQISSHKALEQKKYADQVRISYLRQNKFKLSQSEENLFTEWMSNEKSISSDKLNKLKNKLIMQNNSLNAFDPFKLSNLLNIQ